ncbi:MAG: DUF3300 domain-containing protein [Chthoniobacterales bacterium]
MRTSLFRRAFVLFPAVLLLTGQPAAFGNETDETAPASETVEAPKIPGDQLDSLVAPIALYPDPLLAQTLAASTYPIEIMQLQQWLDKNKDLKDQALADAVAKQPWDPSVQAMAAFPEVAQRMAENIQWTSDMGNAFLAQQQDVMSAVQRMRAKAESTGALKTGEQQKVETKTVGSEQVIVVEQADPNTVYVPSYDPTVVYGQPAYPYPSYSYPGYIAGGALAFGGAMALGAAWGNNWGWGCGWDQGDVNVNVNNNYVNNYNKKNNIKAGEAGKWQHSPEHRGNAPYGDRKTADKFGGRAASGAGRPGGPGGVGGAGGLGKPGGPGGVGKPGGAGGPGGVGKPGGAGGVGKPGGPGGVGKPGSAGGTSKAGGAAAKKKSGGAEGTRPSTKQASRPSGGGANQIGNKNMGNKGSSASRSSGGAISGGSGKQAKASSNRGGKSMGGGGMSGGGGKKGGGGRKKGGGR